MDPVDKSLMAPVQAARRWRGTRRPAAGIGLLVTVAVLISASQASAWSTPQPFFMGAGRDVFSIAGDPAGNAFAVIVGESPDRPLMITERFAAGPDAFTWTGARPLPGGAANFTRHSRGVDGLEASAAGDGAGLIAWRELLAGGDAQVRALVREYPMGFGVPVTIAGTEFAPTGELSAAVNGSGSAVVAIRRGSGRTRGRTVVAWRGAAAAFSRPRTLSPSATSSHVAAIGDDGASIVGWIRGTRVEALRIGGDGKPTKVQRLGTARAAAGMTAALSVSGAGVLAWQDRDGAVRLVRRSAPGRFSVSLPVRIGSRRALVDGMTSVVDDRGRAFVAWRERTGTELRSYVTTAPVGGEFRITRLASGKAIGVPSLAARPGGGAVVTWRSPEGWHARLAPRSGVFAAAIAVSKPLEAPDRSVARASALAGPGERVDLFWPQAETSAPQLGGDLLYQSFEVEG